MTCAMYFTFQYLLPILLIPAVWYDVRTHRIPNWLTFGGIAIGFLVAALAAGIPGLIGALQGFAIAAIVAGIFWYTGAIGGGDHKLLMAVGAWIGFHTIPFVLATIAIVGGFQAMITVLIMQRWKPAVPLRELLRTTPMPYSVSITLGTAFVILSRLLPQL